MTANQEDRQPDEWLEDQARAGCDRLLDRTDALKEQVRQRPLESAAVAFAGGYVASRLPIFGLASLTVRASLRILPYGLMAYGAIHAWSTLRHAAGEAREERDASSAG